ncbi:UNVERIFIED_CONTAM: hypothetical protein K2H54_049227 [Gekko kuhli]
MVAHRVGLGAVDTQSSVVGSAGKLAPCAVLSAKQYLAFNLGLTLKFQVRNVGTEILIPWIRIRICFCAQAKENAASSQPSLTAKSCWTKPHLPPTFKNTWWAPGLAVAVVPAGTDLGTPI